LHDSDAMRHAAVAITSQLSGASGGKQGRRSNGGYGLDDGVHTDDDADDDDDDADDDAWDDEDEDEQGRSRHPGHSKGSHGRKSRRADAFNEQSNASAGLQSPGMEGAVGLDLGDDESDESGDGAEGVDLNKGLGPNESRRREIQSKTGPGNTHRLSAQNRSGATDASSIKTRPPPPAEAAKLVSKLGAAATQGAQSQQAPTGLVLRAAIQDLSRRAAPSFLPPGDADSESDSEPDLRRSVQPGADSRDRKGSSRTRARASSSPGRARGRNQKGAANSSRTGTRPGNKMTKRNKNKNQNQKASTISKQGTWENRSGILSEQVLMAAARLPPHMRPALPDPELRRALLKAMVSSMRVKFR